MARYTALLGDHVRPFIGTRPLKQLTPLEIQAIYDQLTVGGRRDGRPGGLAPRRPRQRVYIHQLPQTAPRLAELIEEGNRRETRPSRQP